MGPIDESGFQPGWFQRGRRVSFKSGDADNDPLPWKTTSLVAMLERRLQGQMTERGKYTYVKNGRKVEVASSLRNVRFR